MGGGRNRRGEREEREEREDGGVGAGEGEN